MIHWGPGLGDDIARAPPASFFSPSYNTPAQPIIYKDGSVERIAPTETRHRRKAPFRYAGIDDHYFVSMLLNDQNTQPVRIDYAPAPVPQADDPAHHRPLRRRTRCASRRRRIRRDSSSVRRPSTSCAAIDPKLTKVDQLRHVLVAGGAAARRAQVGARLHRQLGLGDHRPDAS